MTLPRVAMWSLWRNDAKANLRERALHLLMKSYPALRWAWIVGDSDDSTLADLRAIAAEVDPYRRVDVLRCDTRIPGDTPVDARRRYAATVNQWFGQLPVDADFVIQHESDLRSPINLVEVFLAHVAQGRTHIAGWPILPVSDTEYYFYDIWAYRKDGVLFSNGEPFHTCYRANAPFEVDSVGSCWMFPADEIRQGARFTDEAVLGFCKTLRGWGRHIWVDPHLTILQPRELWTEQQVTP